VGISALNAQSPPSECRAGRQPRRWSITRDLTAAGELQKALTLYNLRPPAAQDLRWDVTILTVGAFNGALVFNIGLSRRAFGSVRGYDGAIEHVDEMVH
jgi:hypothetical protein